MLSSLVVREGISEMTFLSRKTVTAMIPAMECGDVSEQVCREDKRTLCSQLIEKVAKEVIFFYNAATGIPPSVANNAQKAAKSGEVSEK